MLPAISAPAAYFTGGSAEQGTIGHSGGHRMMTKGLMCALLAACAAIDPWVAAAQGLATEEPAIRAVLDNTLKGLNGADLPFLLSQFSDDARIDSKAAKAKVSRERYGEAMAGVFKRGDVVRNEQRDLRVTVVDPTHATVRGLWLITTKTGEVAWPHEWKLEKRDERWVIVETTYK